MTHQLHSYKFDPASQGYILEVESVPGFFARLFGKRTKTNYYLGFGEVWHSFPTCVRCTPDVEARLAEMHKTVEWQLKDTPIILTPGEDEKAVREHMGEFKWKQLLAAGEASDFYGIPMGELTREALLVVVSMIGSGAMNGKLKLPEKDETTA